MAWTLPLVVLVAPLRPLGVVSVAVPFCGSWRTINVLVWSHAYVLPYLDSLPHRSTLYTS